MNTNVKKLEKVFDYCVCNGYKNIVYQLCSIENLNFKTSTDEEIVKHKHKLSKIINSISCNSVEINSIIGSFVSYKKVNPIAKKLIALTNKPQIDSINEFGLTICERFQIYVKKNLCPTIDVFLNKNQDIDANSVKPHIWHYHPYKDDKSYSKQIFELTKDKVWKFNRGYNFPKELQKYI